MKLRKFVATLLLGSAVLMLVPMTSMAEAVKDPVDIQQETTISPRLTYIAEAMADLSISNNTATVDCWVNGWYGEATKAKVIAELQLKSGNDNWIPVAIWTDTQNGFEASVYETKTVTAGNTYRVKATVTVWQGSQSEERIFFTDEVTA